MSPRVLARATAAYYIATGLWAVFHRRSFERMTGRKRDYWLVRLVGGLAAVIGGALAIAARRSSPSKEARLLATGGGVTFGVADVYAARRYSRLYLADLALHAALVPQWWRRWDDGPAA